AHATLYRSLLPAGHGYFGWYEPLLAGASLAALVVMLALAVAALRGGTRAKRFAGALLPEQRTPLATSAVRLGLASLAFLLVQGSLERSAAVGRLSLAAFPETSATLLVCALAALALLLTLLRRACIELLALAARQAPPVPAPVAARVGRPRPVPL